MINKIYKLILINENLYFFLINIVENNLPKQDLILFPI